MKTPIGDSELILNADGSVYHLHLLPEDIADTIILVGDQDRVQVVSAFFDKIEVQKQNREFKTHTGTYKGKRITVLSTGIGTDNIDIVINEIDALVNIDLKTRIPKDEHTTLNFIRIGTSGSLQEEIPVDVPVAAKMSLAFDNLLNFYYVDKQLHHQEMEDAFVKFTNWNPELHHPFIVESSEKLFNTIAKGMHNGITVSAPGFFGPQGRELRLKTATPDLNETLRQFRFNNMKITNLEMECSAIYGLSKLLGHNALTLCLIIANRYIKEFSVDYKSKMGDVIKTVLDRTLEL